MPAPTPSTGFRATPAMRSASSRSGCLRRTAAETGWPRPTRSSRRRWGGEMGEGVPLIANAALDPVRRADSHGQREHDRNREQPCRDPPDAEDASSGEQPQGPGDQSPHGAHRQGGEQGRAARGMADPGRNHFGHRVVIDAQLLGRGGCHPGGHHQQAVDATRATGRTCHHEDQRAEHRQCRTPGL